MRIGYWRTWPSGPRKQEADLEDAGCERVYGESSPTSTMPLVERENAIRTLRPGDEFVVVAPEVLGRTQGEILEGMTEIHRVSNGGAAILDLSTGDAIQYHPDMQAPLEFVARGATALKSRKLAKATKASKGKSGRKRKLQGPAKAAAKVDWLDKSLTSQQVADKHGVSIPLLHRELGSRSGAPDDEG